MFVLYPFDAILNGQGPTSLDRPFHLLNGPLVLAIVVVCGGLQAWGVERIMRILRPPPGTVRGRLRWAWPVLAGVPVAGLYVIVLWDVLARRRPSWAFHDEHRMGPVGLPGRSPSWLNPFLRPRRIRLRSLILWVALLLFPGFLAAICWGHWLLWNPGTYSPRPQVYLGWVALHLLGFVSLTHVLWKGRKGQGSFLCFRSRAAPLLSLVWLVPVPFFPYLSLVGLVALLDKRREKTLARQALENRGLAPEWLLLKERLRTSWTSQRWWRRLFLRKTALDAIPHATETARRFFLFARLKCLFLLPEGAALTLGVYWLRPDLVWIPNALAIFSVVLSGVAMVLTVIRFIKRLVRSSGHRPPYSHYFAAGQLTLLSGLFLGGFLESWGQVAVGAVLTIYGFIGAICLNGAGLLRGVLPIPKEDPSFSRQTFVLTAVLGGVGFAGFNLSIFGEGWQNFDLGLISVLMFVLAALGPAVSLVLYRWLLLPRRLSDITDRNLPLRERAGLVFLTVTALVPFGGLVAPVWCYIRRRSLE